MPMLFAAALLLGAALLFLVEPIVAKMLLPKFGGAPAVWNTCVVFFQATMLAGYLYAHFATAWLTLRKQAALHLTLLLLPFLVLPLAISDEWTAPPEANPILYLIAQLALTCGVPFFLLSTTAPLLQRWFADTGYRTSEDPYYLYAASNLGSMLALFGYPTIIEPYLRLRWQAIGWEAAYAVYVALTAACAWAVLRAAKKAPSVPNPASRKKKTQAIIEAGATPITRWTRPHWVILSAVPSSLMLGATTYLTTDISPIPLLWVLPLSLYLLSFILVFSRLPEAVHAWMKRLMPIAILWQAFIMVTSAVDSIGMVVFFHLATLFLVSMVCHGELARSRPSADKLTEYYAWMSLGGMLGGMFNALAAPWLFNGIAEYPMALVAACLLLPPSSSQPTDRKRLLIDVGIALLFFLCSFRFVFDWEKEGTMPILKWLSGASTVASSQQGMARAAAKLDITRATVQWGIPLAACYFFRRRPTRLGLCLGSLFLGAWLHTALHHNYVYVQRTFFGVLRVESEMDGRLASLSHGSTTHGIQNRTDEKTRRLPLAYYFPTSPIGQLMLTWQKAGRRDPVAVIGLGTGAMAAYGQKGQEITFFDIDPAVVRLATDPSYFTYLAESRAKIRIELGDARLTLEKEPDHHYEIIVVDAFSSDAVPTHLLTREALALYRSKLLPGGIVAFHISNRYLRLEPVIANIAAAEGMVCLYQHEGEMKLNLSELRAGKMVSIWVLVAASKDDFGDLPKDPRWIGLPPVPTMPTWTDDFTDVYTVLKRSIR